MLDAPHLTLLSLSSSAYPALSPRTVPDLMVGSVLYCISLSCMLLSFLASLIAFEENHYTLVLQVAEDYTDADDGILSLRFRPVLTLIKRASVGSSRPQIEFLPTAYCCDDMLCPAVEIFKCLLDAP